MFIVKDTTTIRAPIDRCFLLSTSIELVALTLGMKPVAGRTSGLITAGDRLTWSGWKFGLPQRHQTLITQYRHPGFFQDTMASGRFRHFQHDHEFNERDGDTLLTDTVHFAMPFGPPGRLVGQLILLPHIRKLVHTRFALLKRIAESDEWRRYIPSA